MTHRAHILWLCAALACVHGADTQIVVHLKTGQKLVGEEVLKDGDEALELKICHSYSRTISKAAILKYEAAAASQPARPKAATQPAPRARLRRATLATLAAVKAKPATRASAVDELRGN